MICVCFCIDFSYIVLALVLNRCSITWSLFVSFINPFSCFLYPDVPWALIGLAKCALRASIKHLVWSFNKKNYHWIKAHLFCFLMLLLASVLWMYNDKWCRLDDKWCMLDDGWCILDDEWCILDDEWCILDDMDTNFMIYWQKKHPAGRLNVNFLHLLVPISALGYEIWSFSLRKIVSA